MIYYVTIVDFAEDTGQNKWDFIHPDTPEQLFEHLSSVKDFIPPTTFGIVSVISKDLFGDQLRRMEFKDLQIVIGKMKHGQKEYYVVFLTDIRDHPEAVWRIFNEFYNSERRDFDKVLSRDIVEIEDINKLRTSFAAHLVGYYRENPLFGGRDSRSLIIEFLISFGIMGILAFLTWWINREYGLIKNTSGWITLIFVILLINFVLPGPAIGWITRYRKHAELIALANGVLWTIIVSMLWYDELMSGIENSFHLTVSFPVFLIFVIVSGLIYGSTLMLTSVPFAIYYEKRSLTSPRVISLPHLEKRVEQKDMALDENGSKITSNDQESKDEENSGSEDIYEE